MITLNKLRMFYFFCPNRKAVCNYLQSKDYPDQDDKQLCSGKAFTTSLEIALF